MLSRETLVRSVRRPCAVLKAAVPAVVMIAAGSLGFLTTAVAQDLDLLIKGGRVIDPKNSRNEMLDVGIADGKIAVVAPDVPTSRAQKVVDASGLYVTPGVIDLHVHVFAGTDPEGGYSNGFSSVPPDPFTFRSGVTTVVDAGSAGWKNFDEFVEQTVEHSRTRVLAFLNIVGSGMSGIHEQNVEDMNPKMAALVARQNDEIIVGIKTAHYNGGWEAVDNAVEAGRQAELPVMVDFGGSTPPLPLEALFFEHLRPGDIFTHAYAHFPGGSRESVVDDNGGLRAFVPRAQERGIIFDVGHGGGSLMYSAAIPATEAGFWANTISTDLHIGSMNAGMKDMANVMSKMLALGMPIEEVIEASTWKPAQVINRPELGNLDVGAEADVTVFNLREGEFGYVDSRDNLRPGSQKLEAELTIRAGRVVWDLNGITSTLWRENGAASTSSLAQ